MAADKEQIWLINNTELVEQNSNGRSICNVNFRESLAKNNYTLPFTMHE